MSEKKIATRYAQALFTLAVEQNAVEKINDDMRLIAQVCSENREFVGMLRSPIINSSKKQKIIKSLFEGKIQTITYQFVLILIRKNREHFIEAIAKEFVELYNDHKGIKSVHVTSCVALSDSEKSTILAILKKLTPKEIIFVESLRPSLIGGFLVQMDDYQIDKSIQGKIKQFKRDFDKNLFVKGF